MICITVLISTKQSNYACACSAIVSIFSYYTIFIACYVLLHVDLQCLHCHCFDSHRNTASSQCHQWWEKTAVSGTTEASSRSSRCCTHHTLLHPREDRLDRRCTDSDFHYLCHRSSHVPQMEELQQVECCVCLYIMPQRLSVMLMKCCSKCPNVFARTSMC